MGLGLPKAPHSPWLLRALWFTFSAYLLLFNLELSEGEVQVSMKFESKNFPAACNKKTKQSPVMKIYRKTLDLQVAPLHCILKQFRKEHWHHCPHFTARKTGAQKGEIFPSLPGSRGRGESLRPLKVRAERT